MRVANNVLVASVVTAMGLVACGGKTATTTTSAVGGSLPKVAAKEDLAYLPVNSDIVATIDAAGMRNSALYGRFAPKLLGEISNEMGEVKKRCGFDPMQKLSALTIGVRPSAASEKMPAGVVVVHGFAESDLNKCYESLSAEEKTNIHVRKEGGTWLMGDNEVSVAVGFISADTMVAVIESGATPLTAADFAKALATEGSVLSSPGFAAAWTGTPKGQARFLINAASTWFNDARSAMPGAKLLSGGISVTSEITGSIAFAFDTADHAKALADQFAPFIGILEANMGVKAKLTQEGERVLMDAQVPGDAADKLIKGM